MFFKKAKLEKQLMNEIKSYAKVENFPYDDAKVLGDFLAAYKKGNAYVNFQAITALDTLEKYPELCDAWDQLMIKYKKQGLFPNWDVVPIDD